jgi:hypothetical protein
MPIASLELYGFYHLHSLVLVFAPGIGRTTLEVPSSSRLRSSRLGVQHVRGTSLARGTQSECLKPYRYVQPITKNVKIQSKNMYLEEGDDILTC